MTNDGALELWHQGGIVLGLLAGGRHNCKNNNLVRGKETVALSSLIFSLGHLLINSFCLLCRHRHLVRGDREGHRRGRSRRPWWCESSCLTPHYHLYGGFPRIPEVIYKRGVNEGRPCVVFDGIGRDRHGLCTHEAVIGYQTLYTYVCKSYYTTLAL